MGKWVSAEEAARHLGITTSAVRKRASGGKLAREAQPNGSYRYYLEDDQLDAAVAVEAAMETTGVDVLARVIDETARTQQAALDAIKQAYEGQLAAERELSRELRIRAEHAEKELAEAREALRAERERLHAQAEATDARLRELREAMRERTRRRWWAPWRA